MVDHPAISTKQSLHGWFDNVVRLYTSEMVPVLVIAATERLEVRGAAAEVDTRHIVDDRTDVSELHILLSDTFTATATSCLQLSLLPCSRHPTTVHSNASLLFSGLCSVSQRNHAWRFLTFFPKRLGIFSPNFTSLLHVPIYARLQIFIQLSPTVTKLCHIKCDQPACVSADGGHFEHYNGGRA